MSKTRQSGHPVCDGYLLLKNCGCKSWHCEKSCHCVGSANRDYNPFHLKASTTLAQNGWHREHKGREKLAIMSNARASPTTSEQGCQMVCFQTQTPNLGKICTVSDWKMSINFKAIWNILWTFGIFNDHLAHCVFIWYIFHAPRKIWQPCFWIYICIQRQRCST
jgi:hypothetical protein